MKMNTLSIILLCSVNYIFRQSNDEINKEECSFNEFKLNGKIQFVESFPDDCGEWQIVDSFPDIKIKIVESFGDIKIKFVESFPGIP